MGNTNMEDVVDVKVCCHCFYLIVKIGKNQE